MKQTNLIQVVLTFIFCLFLSASALVAQTNQSEPENRNHQPITGQTKLLPIQRGTVVDMSSGQLPYLAPVETIVTTLNGFSNDFDGGTEYASFVHSYPPGPLSQIAPSSGTRARAGEILADDPDKMYAIQENFEVNIIDLVTGNVSLLGTATGLTNIVTGMALDPNTNTYYVVDLADKLYTLDMTTLVASYIGTVPLAAYGFSSLDCISMVNRGGQDVLLGFDLSSSAKYGGQLFWYINPATAAIVEVFVYNLKMSTSFGITTDFSTNTCHIVTGYSASGSNPTAQYFTMNPANTYLYFYGPLGNGLTYLEYLALRKEVVIVCEGFVVRLNDSNGDPLAGGSLEYREGGGNLWLPATEMETGVFCCDTERDQVGLRMTYGPQVLLEPAVPTNEEYTFQTEYVTLELLDGTSQPVEGGEASYTSNGWHDIGTTDASGTVGLEMLPNKYTFQMKMDRKSEKRKETVSPSNNWFTFFIDDLKTAGINENDESVLAVYPNPFSGTANMSISLAEAQEVTVAVYDMNGRQIEILHEGYLPEGNHKLQWDAHVANKGIYIVRSTMGNTLKTDRIIKM